MKGVWANENALGEGWYPVIVKVVPFPAVNDKMPWPSTSEALVNHLRQFVGPRDRILVVEKSNPAS